MTDAARVLTQEKPQVPCFGLHQGKNNIPYLFQDYNPTGYDFRGKNTDSGLVSTELRGSCPHAMNLYLRNRSVPKRHAKDFRKISSDPLVQAMAPIPHKYKQHKIYHFDEESLIMPSLWLRTLERMSSPLYSHVLNVQNITRAYVLKALRTTNIQPLVIYGITEIQTPLIKVIVAEAEKLERTVVLIGTQVVSGYPVSKTKLTDMINLNDLVLLPMEHIGVRLLDNLVSNKELPW